MPTLVSLADIRDVFVIVYVAIGIVLFLVALVVTLVLFFIVKGLLKSVSSMLDDSVKPALASVREAADTVRGTTEFVGKTAVAPIARAYGVFAGLRKALSVISGLRGKR